MNLLQVIAEKTELENKLAKITKKFEKESEELNKRLSLLSEYEVEILNGKPTTVIEGKEKVGIVEPLEILFHLDTYLYELKKAVSKNWKELTTSNLHLLRYIDYSNRYKMSRLKTELVKKHYSSRYELLGYVTFNEDTSERYFDDLLVKLLNLKEDIKITKTDEYSYRDIEENIFKRFEIEDTAKYITNVKLTTSHLEILELLNFPKEITVTQKFRQKAEYRLEGNEYKLYYYNNQQNEWQLVK